MRLDQFLAKKYPEFSRATWQKYISSGRVSVKGKVVNSPKTIVSETDKIEFDLPEKPNFSDKTLPVMFEDDNIIVVNKPAGILTHSKGAMNDEFSVAEFFRDKTTYNADTNRPGIIHRLDRATSGVLIGAKNPETAKLLQKQFADRKAKKNYLAIVEKTPKEQKARIDLPVARDPKHPSRFRVDAKGKSALTDYEVKKILPDGKALVELKPQTGRTHQLRIHLSYIGAPIVGDPVYGNAAKRMYLHAYRLEITVPGGERKIFEAPLPAEFEEVING